MLTKDTAICIRATDFSETSQIVTFFTEVTGKISAIAKGSKRPKSAFDGPIEMFSYGEIVFSGSTREKLATLTEFGQQPAFTHLCGNFFVLNCAFFAAELLNLLTDEYDPHPQLFNHSLSFLRNLNQLQTMDKKLRIINQELSFLILFQLALLKEIGLQPILTACVNCKSVFNSNWAEIYFSSSANGLVCRDCEGSFSDKIKLTGIAANCLNNLREIADADKKTLSEIEKILVYHFTNTLGHPPKMARYILNH